MQYCCVSDVFFFFNDTATTEIYTLSLHDALPICVEDRRAVADAGQIKAPRQLAHRQDLVAVARRPADRKSTRLNSSHSQISYAVFCLKKKNRYASRYARLRTRSSRPPSKC